MHSKTPNDDATHGVSPYRLSREHVTHARAITDLLALASPSREARRPTPREREALIAHVAGCADCWATLAALHGDIVDAGTENADMEARFGCEPVRDRLFLLVGLDPAAIARDHAAEARHLAWCLACRTRLVEIVEVERELARAPRWAEVGERVREAVGRLVLRVGRTAAGWLEVPDGFVLGPLAAPVAVRGTDAATSSLASSAEFELGDTGVAAEIVVEPGAGPGAGFSLRLTNPVEDTYSLHVREARDDGDALIARYTLRAAESVAVRGLWPGSFLLELHGARDASVHRVRLDIGPGA
jgi:hypothetical protein